MSYIPPAPPRSHASGCSRSLLGLAVVLVLGLLPLLGHGQAVSTTRRGADLQVGGGFSGADSDYSEDNYYGFFIYGTLDVTSHLGVDANFHRISGGGNSSISESSFDIGPRFVLHLGRRYNPYVKGVVGYGSLSAAKGIQTGSSLLAGGGVGIDVNVTRHVNVRGEAELQRWFNFGSSGLSPKIISVGAAYRF